MELGCIQYTRDRGWSPSTFPDLDSERTLVLLFGASEFRDDPVPVADVSRAFPKSTMLGCSTAGEIFGSTIHDKSISVAAMRFCSVSDYLLLPRRFSLEISDPAYPAFRAARRRSCFGTLALTGA
jgi:hypothetical protein